MGGVENEGGLGGGGGSNRFRSHKSIVYAALCESIISNDGRAAADRRDIKASPAPTEAIGSHGSITLLLSCPAEVAAFSQRLRHHRRRSCWLYDKLRCWHWHWHWGCHRYRLLERLLTHVSKLGSLPRGCGVVGDTGQLGVLPWDQGPPLSFVPCVLHLPLTTLRAACAKMHRRANNTCTGLACTATEPIKHSTAVVHPLVSFPVLILVYNTTLFSQVFFARVATARVARL